MNKEPRKKFLVPLSKQENDRLWELLEEQLKANSLLKRQYAELQDNFHDLLKDGFEKWIKKQVYPHLS